MTSKSRGVSLKEDLKMGQYFKKDKRYLKAAIILFVFGLVTVALIKYPGKPRAAGTLTSASATLANSRLSFSGQVNTGVTNGTTTVNIKTTGTIPDLNTNHLFPGDTVSVGVAGSETVGAVVDSDTFVLADGINAAASNADPIYATQSGALTVVFTITNDIPANGYAKVTIPDPAANGNDGAPDTGASTSVSGFDLNGMGTGDVATTGGTGCTWSGTETLTAGSGSSHTYKQVTTTICTAGAITVTFDGASKDLVNPAPVTTGHTQGTADVYTITIGTYDSSDNLIDTVDVAVAPVEAVLVSATVEETLSFAITAVNSGTTACGQAVDVTTTAYSVPWGALDTTAVSGFKEAAQQLTLSTNALNGYAVKVEESDQMGLNGNTCTGTAPSAGDYTFDSATCIRDTVCDATCSESASTEWNTATNEGMGFSLANIDGTDAAFLFNESSRTFSSRQFADEQGAETEQTIMSNTGPVNSKDIYTCFRLTISAIQPAGYYYNKVRYTATPTF